ncbi:MAG TPA: hypothetical protein VFM58_19265 [Solirubrobacteraceae bacterium]|nr:hypothetical protein [Solirubrobacteraceae bacterium]
MPAVVAVHGIGQQLKGAHTLHDDWYPAMRDGLERARVTSFAADELACAFYGDVFRPPGSKALREPAYGPNDVDAAFELPLLLAWWQEAARQEPEVAGPGDAVKARTPLVAQRALRALATSRFFGGLSDRAMIGDLKQVTAYMTAGRVREVVQQRVAAAVAPDTRVLVGHSLGSVVAYEVLASGACPDVATLVTLGSPLGIPNLVFHRLTPPPQERGAWPGNVRSWVNVADRGDVVALAKSLAPMFSGAVEDRLVHNGATAHDARPYLTAEETGQAIASSL